MPSSARPPTASDLVRFDGSTWSRWPLEDTEVGPSVSHFDDATRERHLLDICVHAIDTSADGAVWLLAKGRSGPSEPRHLYVITPEGVARVSSRIDNAHLHDVPFAPSVAPSSGFRYNTVWPLGGEEGAS